MSAAARTSSSALSGHSTASRCASMHAPIPTSRSSTQASSNRRRFRRSVPNLYRFEADQYQWTLRLGTYARRTLGWRQRGHLRRCRRTRVPSWRFHRDVLFARRPGSPRRIGSFWTSRRTRSIQDTWCPGSRGAVEGLLLTGTTVFGPVGGTGTMAPRWGQTHPPLKRHLLVGWQLLYPKPDPVLRGVVGASSDPFRPAPPAWRQYLKAFSDAFPRLDDPYLSNQPYYDGVEPVLEALEKVNGDLSDGQRRFSDALAHLRYHSPEGLITLDRRHQAIAPIYLGRVVVPAHGKPYVKQIHVFKHVHQTLGGLFSRTSPPPSQTQPACRAG